MKTSFKRTILTACALFVVSPSLWPQGQTRQRVTSIAKEGQSQAAAPTDVTPLAEPNAPPQVIRVGNTEMPLTEIVPSMEAAQNRLQEILGKTQDPELVNLQQSLDGLSARLEKSEDESLYLVQNARSAEQLSETRYLWQRNREELEKLDSTVRSHVQALTEQQSQVRVIKETWSAAAKSAEGLALPGGLLERMQQVPQTAAKVDAAVRSTLEFFVNIQVGISESRKIVDEVLRQIDVAEQGLNAGLFLHESPPLWSALRGGAYASLQRQVRITGTAVRSRILDFYFSYRNNLLAYFVLLLVLTAAFFRLGVSEERQATHQQFISLRLLQRPCSLAAFTLLYFFGAFFPKAPPEVFRFARFLLIFPVLRLALAVFEDELRRPVIALSIFFALDHVSSHAAAGTLLRRLLMLFLTAASLAGLAWLLRTRSGVPALLARKRWTIAGVLARFALIILAVSAVSNIVGGASLADLLTHGTLRAIYAAVVMYLMYMVLGGLVSLLTTTRIGQMSRVVRLHRELVLARLDTVLKLGGWIAWVGIVLFGYQIAHEVRAGFRSVLNYRWALGATSISLGDVFLFFVVLVVTIAAAKAIRFFLEEELLPRTSLNSGVAQAGSRLAHYTLVLIGFFLAWAAAGLDLSRLTLLTGAFGVGLGFGLQNLVGNFVSGIIISLERPMRVGDIIEIGDLLGKVTKIGFRSSTVRTADGAEVIVPNSDLVTKSFVNWSLSDELRRGELRVTVSSGSEPARVVEILANAARSHPAVLNHPQPFVTFERFGKRTFEFSLRFWTRVESLDDVRSDLNLLVAQELEKYGILARSRSQPVQDGVA